MNSSPDSPVTPAAARSEGGIAIVAIGATLLFVSLFLHWYQPGRSAWTVFEVWDLVLAGLSMVALVAAAGRLGIGPRRSDSWLVAPSAGALVIVVASLLNHPPAAIGEDPMIGIWLALIATVLMVAGVVWSVAGVSVAINIHPGAANRADITTPDRGGSEPGRTRGLRLRRPAPPTASPTDAAAAHRPGPTAAERETEATRVLGEDPARRHEPPPPAR